METMCMESRTRWKRTVKARSTIFYVDKHLIIDLLTQNQVIFEQVHIYCNFSMQSSLLVAIIKSKHQIETARDKFFQQIFLKSILVNSKGTFNGVIVNLEDTMVDTSYDFSFDTYLKIMIILKMTLKCQSFIDIIGSSRSPLNV